ncbi:MAG TPA: translation initiation factor IF-2 [Terriglobales bacterium]|nr:translation initiation factor IF-2 [Terriglobales bacterium]
MKIRINDLARELEVKSKEILDALPKVGVTEKKTHSSSIEADEAERVKKFFAGQHHGAKPAARTVEEHRPKIDLSKISKPGDVLKAITELKEHAAHPVAPARPKAAEPPKPAAPAKPTVAAKPAAPAAHKPAAPVAEPPAPEKPAHTPRMITPQTVARPAAVVIPPSKVEKPVPPPEAAKPALSAEKPVTAEPVAPVPPPPAAEAPKPPVAVEPPAPPAAEKRIATPPPPPAAQQPQRPAAGGTHTAKPHGPGHGAPPRRLIVPQTGPRPVYTAPPQAAKPPIAPRAPVRGQPIFQRPRPQQGGAPGSRPMSRPGERRPMHPTSRPMGGAAGRPLGVGPGLPPPGAAPGRPSARPGAPSRRPGQRYVPRGQKEGPMKGFVPPPRLSLSTEPLPITRSITITEGISVKDLAEKLEIRAKDLIARLLARGVFATINQTLDEELARDMARQFGADTSVITFEDQIQQELESQALAANDEAVFNEVTRPPVVTIMGHVDHGKTSLLDAIRETNVAEGEAGGITQHIGAYKVRITDENSPALGREIVFLDTPGHEAFTRMRARGAKVTDIVVLVVAADDGVMPQTLEAIDHAKAAKVPLIVAVNKIDKPDALPDRVKKQLGDRGLVPEDWGGETVFVDVSAKKRTNLNLLLEMICLVADLQNLKATPERLASGVVLEAKLDRGRGPVATVLVENGTLQVGENFVVGNVFGKVRAMFDDRGRALDSAPPSSPVEILGLEGLPQAGDQFVVVSDREKAREVSEYREMKAREAQLAKSSRVSLEGLAEQIKQAGVKELAIILKADVGGSVEVISDLLNRLSNDQVKINVMRASVGAITESDVLLASASNAIIIGFNVRPERKAQEMAEQEKVEIRLHSIIYELQDEMKKAMAGMLEPTIKETYLGRAEVRDTFRIPKVGTVAGCYVQDGAIKRDAEIRLLRDNVVIFKGKISSLKRFKDDAREVTNGMECGIGIHNYNDIKVGDVIEAFVTEKVAAELTV